MRLRILALGGVAAVALLAPGSASALDVTATCPPGTTGVVITNNGSTTMVCTTLVRDVEKLIPPIYL